MSSSDATANSTNKLGIVPESSIPTITTDISGIEVLSGSHDVLMQSQPDFQVVPMESAPTETEASTNQIVCTPIPPLPDVQEFLPLCDDDKKPKLNQKFKTVNEGEAFYRAYAKLCGFTCRISTSRKLKGDGDTIELKELLCNRAGEKELRLKKRIKTNTTMGQNGETGEPIKTRTTKITRVNCKARIQFKRNKENGMYFVQRFHEGHNHPVASPESTMFLKENREMTTVQKIYAMKNARLKIGAVKSYRGWKELSGGYNNVGATESDFKNFVRDIKSYIKGFDGQMFIENFITKKEVCSSFYFDFEIDEENNLSRVFWADTVSLKNYMLFGDMASVDSTFRTNRYNMVFVPFTGVDHHKRCVTFGAGLLSTEDTESYKWLFSTFLEAMEGCQPKVLITDQDPAMKAAIKDILPETTHRLCMWHITKKLREKVSAEIFQDEEFTRRFHKCVWNNMLEPEEFEAEWANIMLDFDLHQHPWFTYLFQIRESWIPAYFKEIFMGGLMRVTSRSESENSFFDRFMTSHLTLVEFWLSFECAMETQRHKQAKCNSDTKHSIIALKTPIPIEVHAREIYTHAVFKDFQIELDAACFKCGMLDMNRSGATEVYDITDCERPNKKWQVVFEPETIDMTCSCYLFQRMGVLCRHSLWVLKNKNIVTIPEKYLVHRWTKDAMKKPVFNKKGELLVTLENLNDRKKLTTEVWQEVYSCVSVAEENEEYMKELIEKLRDLRLEFSMRTSGTRAKKDKIKEMEMYVGCSIPTQVLIKPPKKSKNKGSGKRIESKMLNAIAQSKKKRRVCKSCGRKGHNSRTCSRRRQDINEEEEEEEEDEDEEEEEEEDEDEEEEEDEDSN